MNKFTKRLLNYINSPKVLLNVILNTIAPYIHNDETFLKLKWRLNMGYPLDLENPRTFSEKLQWLKLFDRKPIYTTMVDKYDAKKYVANIIGQEYIIPTIAVYDSVEDINFELLPDQFVLKCTHDSGGLVICRDKKRLNQKSALKKLNHYLHRRYFWQNREWPYKNVKQRIIAEQYMSEEINSNKNLVDYKFFCFEGEPACCQVICGRESKMTIDFFDKEWNHLPFHEPRKYPFSEKPISKPSNYSEMWKLASVLSKEHHFLRVDFYNINNKVYFGELTFYPTSGMGGFDPFLWDVNYGKLIKLPKLK